MLTQKKLLTIKNAISVFDLLDQEKQPKVIFTTQRDNRVDDKICLQLAGIAFEIDDPLRPIIPDDTHPNCRCYYVDAQTGQVVTDISSKRDIKKRDELTDNQRKGFPKKNLTQKKMDLIIKTMEQNEEWQEKSKNFEPTEDTGIRPLRYNLDDEEKNDDYEWIKKYTKQKNKKASIELIKKWLNQI
tara:strand:+ start:10421 stop:10978 length:558 start_codon:yes stop_codon:yes gene_type:complete